MNIDELDYVLPEGLIAQEAMEPRDHSRLLVVDRKTGELSDRHFYDLPDYLWPGDVLVTNNTQVLPARVFFQKPTGGRVEGLFLREIEAGRWEMMIKGLAKLRPGIELIMEGCEAKFIAQERLSEKTVEMRVEPAMNPVEFLKQFGRIPLPPYIRRKDMDENLEHVDAKRYQTIFGKKPGAVAAPTAGLHFTPKLLEAIEKKGVKIASVTLHVGMGTFEPVNVQDLRDHPMHSEWYSVDTETAQIINDARLSDKRIVAIGTTSVRVLETVARNDGLVLPRDGWTQIFIYPPYKFKIVDRLVTNFHLPRTTLLAMIYAMAGKESILRAYQHAIAKKYRFYSYGDAMMIF
jgi:S-adenosylmethionine:tRNA ribosyltransferase-isomerase